MHKPFSDPTSEQTDTAWRRRTQFARRHPTIIVGFSVLAALVLLAIVAPYVTDDPRRLNPINRLKAPSAAEWFGTDNLGRSIFDRTLYGTRISLIVGLSVALASMAIGLVIGLLAGYLRAVDAVVMRIMDGMMAIPSILLAIAVVALFGSSVVNVIIAITIPEIPRVVRLVRAVVLTIREQPYIAAAVSVGTQLPKMLRVHVLPNTIAPLIVQATYVCASAVIVEAFLSFLGAGTPPEIPSWGNMVAEGRVYFQIAPWWILFPCIGLTILVLTINVLGDGLRDTLDPRIARRMR